MFRGGLFILFLLIPGLSHAAEWQRLETGLSYKKIEFKKNENVSYTLHAFKILPRHFSFKPLLSSPEGYAPIRKMVESNGAMLGVNASFFDSSEKPLGLIKRDGQQLNPFKNISWWGVFYIEKGIPHIVHSKQFVDSPKVTMAIQAGPRLVVEGTIPKLKSESSQKTALGITKHGEIILVATLYPLDIRELAKIFKTPEDKGGLGCPNAINFDGGSSSQLYAKSGGFELRLPSYVGVPVGLGVFRK